MKSMKPYSLRIRTVVVLFASVCLLAASTACGGKEKNTNAVSPADTLSSQEQTVRRVNVDEAFTVTADGNEVGEIFLLQYNWYGKEFVSEDSLNKTMMLHYVSKDTRAPYAKDNAEIRISFDEAEGVPSSFRLTQYANTVRANSGLPFDTAEIELTAVADRTFAFTLDYRKYGMYYYLLECEWENGNAAQYAFAVEKNKE